MAEIVDESGDLPRAFGPYTLLALLGRGGMGEVYLASRSGIAGIERRCVVKTLRAGFGDDHEYVTRFLDEARIVVQLHHRNICPVFDVGKVGVRHYLAMEYIAGRDLRTIAHRARQAGRPLDAGLALHVLSEVLEALEYAHSLADPATGLPLHLVHRDVSPHNVMIGFDGDTRLIDFGLAASTLKIEHTAPNMVMGKVAYMAPEQVCAEPVDARADQLAAAIMGYELLVGERYYEGRPAKEIFQLAARGEFRPEKLLTLPHELRAILTRALSEKREDRFPSCGAMREAIDAYRYANGLRGDVPMMRALVQSVFEDDRVAERTMISRLIGAQSGSFPLPPPGPADAPVRARIAPRTGELPIPDVDAMAPGDLPPSLTPFEPTERSASAPAPAPDSGGSVEPARPAVHLDDQTEATVSRPAAAIEPTVRINRDRDTRRDTELAPAPAPARAEARRRPAAATIGVLGALGLVVIVGLLARRGGDDPETDPTPNTIAVVDPTPRPLVPKDPSPPPAVVAEPAPIVEAAPAPVLKPPPRSTQHPGKPAPAHSETPSPPTVTVVEPPPAPQPAPAPRPRLRPQPDADAPLNIKVNWLKSECPQNSCTVSLANTKYGTLDRLPLQEFKSLVRQCMASCEQTRR